MRKDNEYGSGCAVRGAYFRTGFYDVDFEFVCNGKARGILKSEDGVPSGQDMGSRAGWIFFGCYGVH